MLVQPALHQTPQLFVKQPLDNSELVQLDISQSIRAGRIELQRVFSMVGPVGCLRSGKGTLPTYGSESLAS